MASLVKELLYVGIFLPTQSDFESTLDTCSYLYDTNMNTYSGTPPTHNPHIRLSEESASLKICWYTW